MQKFRIFNCSKSLLTLRMLLVFLLLLEHAHLGAMQAAKKFVGSLSDLAAKADQCGQTMADAHNIARFFSEVVDTTKKTMKTLAGTESETHWMGFHKAAAEGNLEELQRLFNSGVPADIRDAHGITALHRAAYKGKINALDLLILLGVPCDVQDNYGLQPLHYAAQNQQLPTLYHLVKKHRVPVDALSKNQLTALHDASRLGHTNTIERLIRLGAVVDAQKEVISPFLYSASNGKVESMVCLAKAGARIEARSKGGKGAIHYAAAGGHQPVVTYVVTQLGIPVDTPDQQGATALHHAVLQEQVSILQCLKELNARVNAQDEAGRTVLHYAVEHIIDSMIPPLLEMGVDPNLGDRQRRTPLHLAARKGHVEIARMLLLGGALVDAVDEQGLTPLLYALKKGHINMVKLLVASNASLEMQCAKGLGFADYVLGLDDAALTYLVSFIDPELLKGVNERQQTSLHKAAQQGHGQSLASLMRIGISAAAQDDRGCHALHYAAQSGSVEAVEKLWNPQLSETPDSQGRTPLFYAAKGGKSNVFAFLVSKGADWRKGDNESNSVLHAAAESGSVVIVEQLVASGARASLKNNTGLTPYKVALVHNHTEAAAILSRAMYRESFFWFMAQMYRPFGVMLSYIV